MLVMEVYVEDPIQEVNTNKFSICKQTNIV